MITTVLPVARIADAKLSIYFGTTNFLVGKLAE